LSYRVAPRLAWQVIDGEAIVIDLGRGRTLGLNAAGSLIWSLLPAHDEDSIAGEVARRFAVTRETARRDVDEFLTGLTEQGLLVRA
jgi:hypothetical protein